MKKILLMFGCLFLVVGCSCSNDKAADAVEKYLNDYKGLSDLQRSRRRINSLDIYPPPFIKKFSPLLSVFTEGRNRPVCLFEIWQVHYIEKGEKCQ